MSTKSKIEICANSVESAVKAQEGGAYRVELCAGIPEGGTTPSFGEMRMARQLLQKTKLHVIIRPRGGDFLYSQLEQEIMLHDIKVARQLGADGVVFGCLTAEGNVDVPAMKKLMNAVGNMNVTFHRAFDMCRNPQEALEQIIELGCTRILTSGQEANAVKGIPLLKELVKQAVKNLEESDSIIGTINAVSKDIDADGDGTVLITDDYSLTEEEVVENVNNVDEAFSVDDFKDYVKSVFMIVQSSWSTND